MSLNLVAFALLILEIVVGIAAFVFGDKYPKLRTILGVLFVLVLIPLAYFGLIALSGDKPSEDSNTTISTPSSQLTNPTQPFPNITNQHWTCIGENAVTNGTNVTIERLGTCHITLSEGDVILGTADRFQEDVNLPESPQPPCTAFAIKGPIEMDLQIWWGGWDYRTNLDDATIDQYLEGKKSECLNNHPDREVKVVKLP